MSCMGARGYLSEVRDVAINWTSSFCFLTGYQAVAGRFFFFMLALILVSYTATAMSLAISAGMEVVAVANLLITICFVLMLVST